MAARRRVTVLVVADDREARQAYVDRLVATGYMAHAVEAAGAETAARATPFHLAILDSVLDEAGLAVAERLAALERRPRLIAVTSRAPTGAPVEWLFDVYLEKPCAPDVVIDAMRSIRVASVGKKDLLIIARDRVGISDVLHQFGGTAVDLDIRLDLRRGERRRRGPRSRTMADRRRADRRALDVRHWLKSHGWAFIPAANRT
jgi:DNA-binding response OmpR family regulator